MPTVEILYFDECPNYEGTLELVERIVRELGVSPAIELVRVPGEHAAAKMRFLGSPTVRVDGRDVEPGADERRDFVLACRVYRGERGFSGHPHEAWIRDALQAAA